MRETTPYRDRTEAGRVLAGALRGYAGRDDVVVLALPRGGVPVAYEVAMELGAPLDLMLVRKLGFPGREELAIGAVASGGVRVLNPETAGYLSPEVIERITGRELAELARRQRRYRGDKPLPELGGRTIILIDDGLATGSTMRAAVAALRQLGPESIVVAVPVAPPSTIEELRPVVDDIVCPRTPELFFAIGQWYLDFTQTSDEEVVELLQRVDEAVKARSSDRPSDGSGNGHEHGSNHGHAAADTGGV
jgi:predicted phosphoribosyltransferase